MRKNENNSPHRTPAPPGAQTQNPRPMLSYREGGPKLRKSMKVALSTALFAASLWLVVRAAVSGEPELLSAFPFGGQQGVEFKTTIRGRSLDHATAVRLHCHHLSAHIVSV